MRFIIFVLISFLYSCGNDYHNQDKSCNSMMKEFIVKSGFKSKLVSKSGKNGTTAWDDVFSRVIKEKNNYTIHLYFENEDKREVTIAWLRLLLKERIMLDVSIDDTNPDTLTFFNNILILQKKGCLP